MMMYYANKNVLLFLSAAALSSSSSSSSSNYFVANASSLPYTQNGACGAGPSTRCYPGACCSQWGWCGISDGHCNVGCQESYGDCAGSSSSSSSGPSPTPKPTDQPTPKPTDQPTPKPTDQPTPNPTPLPTATATSSTPPPTTPNPTSGPSSSSSQQLPISTNGGCGASAGTRCAPGYCCSEWGFCGTSSSHCNVDCQESYGDCPSTSSGGGGGPSPTPKPTPTPTDKPTPLPTNKPTQDNTTPNPIATPAPQTPSPITPAPTMPTTTGGGGGNTCSYCGYGIIGNGICEDRGLCCSQHGWCGTSLEHCNGGTCGGGNVGNLVCADTSLCCSQYGHCGYTDEHCGCSLSGIGGGGSTTPAPQPPTPNPTPYPTPTNPVPVSSDDDSSRLIAYVGNWQTCPTESQWAQYTHIVIAFAVSYQWSPSKNVCSSTCDIAEPSVCENASNPTLIQQWKDAGKKVILSFGGAGMGGSWAESVDDCWEYCFGREQHVVTQLVNIVNNMGLDGIDLDYEYYYYDGQNGSGFNKGAEAQHFLEDVTNKLRQQLPTGSIVTHAPMDSDVVEGTAYYNILKNSASILDFLMPQYYNGVTRPGSNPAGAIEHYKTLTDDMFNGDAKKVVFGFCISDCSGTNSNLDGSGAATFLDSLQVEYPCNGGAFFWVAYHDVNGGWSIPVSNKLQENICPSP